MGNSLVEGLLVGATVVTFDGDRSAEGSATLWQVVSEIGITWSGVGAPYLVACR